MRCISAAFCAALLGMQLCAWIAAEESALPQLSLSADLPSVEMGRSVTLDVTVRDSLGQPVGDCLLLPYVNGKRWGAHEVSTAEGVARFHLPMPNPGPASIAVRALPGFFSPCWIWSPRAASPQAFLARRFSAARNWQRVSLRAAASGHAKVFLNAQLLREVTGNATETLLAVPEGLLRDGENVIAIEADAGQGMACVAAQLRACSDGIDQTVSTDGKWSAWEQAPAEWPAPALEAAAPARVLARLWDGLLPVEPFAAWFGNVRRDDLFAGRVLPEDAIVSNAISVEVSRRSIASRRNPDRLVGMQWGSYFFPGGFYWQTAQAVPLTGYYETSQPDHMRQQILWLMDMGVDFLMADWPIYIPPDAAGEQHFSDRNEFGIQQMHVTTMMLETLAAMRDEGLPVPGMVIMAFLANGPANTKATVNEQLDWLDAHYFRNPRFHDLWVIHEGKPLVMVLYTGAQPAENMPGPPMDTSRFTLRFVGTQLQAMRTEKFGHWSWMDGVAEPIVTFHDGRAESVTPAAAFFTLDTGWRGSQAQGRRNGATMLRSFVPALREKPQFVLLHQWNEFTGQAEGYPYENGIYGDSYSVELSDDIEPVSLTSAGYRGDQGGWGFLYANLCQALIDLYKQTPLEDTLLALHSPVAGTSTAESTLQVAWEAVGKPPAGFTVFLDDRVAATGLSGNDYSLDISHASEGKHKLSVLAEHATCHYRLQSDRMDERSIDPIPVRGDISFSIIRPVSGDLAIPVQK